MKPYERFALFICALLAAAFVYVIVTPLPYDEPTLSEVEPRNAWGQHLPLDIGRLCEGTVLQWHSKCIERKEAQADE